MNSQSKTNEFTKQKGDRKMTKKMQNMIIKLSEKMNTEFWLYENGFNNFSKAYKCLMEEQHKFDDMRSNMFHFGLISEEEFLDTTHTASDLFYRKVDAMQEIECRK